MRSVNLFYYSMTGQSELVARRFADELGPDHRVQLIRVEPSEPRWQLKVPFVPLWSTFFATLLPTLLGKKIAITTTPAEWPASDAVVVASATWWDRPCLPIQALLAQPAFQAHVRGKPVGLYAVCRGAFARNLRLCEEKIREAGGFVVARDRFTFTGSFLATMLTFFAWLRIARPQATSLGVRLPAYGFSRETMSHTVGFAQRFARASWQPADHPPPRATSEKLLSLLLYGLAVFDLALFVAFVFFGRQAIGLVAPEAYAEPIFFQRCVGLFLLQYAWVQWKAGQDPHASATCLTMTVAVRLSFPLLYLSQVALWGAPWTLLHTGFVASAVLDVAASLFILKTMSRLRIGLLQGDRDEPESPPGNGFLRGMLLILAIAEFLIAWNWLLLPEFWCRAFDVALTVDPFWTRATGVMLLNIAFIQFLAARDPRKFRSAAIVSGLFRALWPILYWVTVASGEGNGLFRFSILFFSFFDLVSCLVIFALLRRPAPAEPGARILRSEEGAAQP